MAPRTKHAGVGFRDMVREPMGRGPDPRSQDVRALLVRSGNRCAFPNCQQRVVNERNDFIAQICHIRAASPEGPRYEKQQTDEERRSASNLLILCYPHHVEVDGHPDEFTVKQLLEMKTAHEARVHEFAPSPETVLQALLQPNLIHSLPSNWLSALASRAAFRCLPLVGGGAQPFQAFGPRTYLATALIGVGALAYAMTLDPENPDRSAANVAHLIAYGAGGKLTPNAPPPGAVDAATSMARASMTARLAGTEHYGTSIDAREAMRLSAQAMPDSFEQLQRDLAIAAAPGTLPLETFLLSPLWEAGVEELWRPGLDRFVEALKATGGGTVELLSLLADGLVNLSVGTLVRSDIEAIAHAWATSELIHSRVVAENEASRN